jgi:hypothetical protein
MSYSSFRQLEKALLALGKKRGFNGTPFLPEPAPLGSLQQEMDAVWLSLDVQPRPRTEPDRLLVREWARGIVLTSGPEPAAPKRHQSKRKERAW